MDVTKAIQERKSIRGYNVIFFILIFPFYLCVF